MPPVLMMSRTLPVIRTKPYTVYDDDDSYGIRHWTDVPPGEVCIVPSSHFSSRGRLRAGPFLARDV